jgi:hypothetical protein
VKAAGRNDAVRIESYIVRIYRRRPGRERVLIGVVEHVGRDRRSAFGSADELWQILTASRAVPSAGISAKRRRPWDGKPRS